jgi:hypothetical protein
VGTPVNWPRKEPIAVRLAPTMTMLTSDMSISAKKLNGQNARLDALIIAADGKARQTRGGT